MKSTRRVLLALSLAVGTLAAGSCYGTGTAYVGVYGPGVYGPGAWGGYPYPGRYPPVGGGVWIGAPRCCEEQDDLDVQELDDSEAQPDAGGVPSTVTETEQERS